MDPIRAAMPFRASPPSRRTALGLTAGGLAAGGLAAAALAHPSTVFAATDDPAILAFRDEVAAILRSDFPRAEVTLDSKDPEQILIGRFTLYLGNLRRTVTGRDSAARRQEILRIVGPLATAKPKGSEPTETFAQASRRLRIQLVPNQYRDQAPELVCRRFSDKLLVAYALDEPNRYQMVTQPIFEPWGVPQNEVERIAKTNLNQASGGLEVQISPTGKTGHFATLESTDGYAAARLLLSGVMDQIREAFGTTAMVVAVPMRDILIAWSPDSEARFRLMGVVTKLMQESPYGRSTELFRATADDLRLLTPAELFEYRRQG